MAADRAKMAETMAPCETYSGWAAKYLRGDFNFIDVWNEVKGITPEPEATRPIEDPQNQYG